MCTFTMEKIGMLAPTFQKNLEVEYFKIYNVRKSFIFSGESWNSKEHLDI